MSTQIFLYLLSMVTPSLYAILTLKSSIGPYTHVEGLLSFLILDPVESRISFLILTLKMTSIIPYTRFNQNAKESASESIL